MKYTHTFSTKLDNGDKVQTTVTFDYEGVPEKTLLEWATSNRAIALQRVMRPMTAEQVRAAYDGKTLAAASVGKKVKTLEEVKQDLINAGISSEIVDLILSNPDKLNELLNK